jgi:hypothetical protein
MPSLAEMTGTVLQGPGPKTREEKIQAAKTSTKNPLMVADSNEAFAISVARVQNLMNTPEYKSASPEDRKAVLGIAYDGFMANVWKQHGAMLPPKDEWVARAEKDIYHANIGEYFDTGMVAFLNKAGYAFTNEANKLASVVSHAGVQVEQKAFDAQVGISKFFHGTESPTLSAKPSAANYTIHKAADSIDSSLEDSTYWSAYHPDISFADKAGHFAGDAAFQLPLYGIIGEVLNPATEAAVKFLSTGSKVAAVQGAASTAVGLDAAEMLKLFQKLPSIKTTLDLGKEATSGFIGGKLMGEDTKDALKSGAMFAGFAGSLKGAGKVLGRVFAKGGEPIVKQEVENLAKEAEKHHGVGLGEDPEEVIPKAGEMEKLPVRIYKDTQYPGPTSTHKDLAKQFGQIITYVQEMGSKAASGKQEEFLAMYKSLATDFVKKYDLNPDEFKAVFRLACKDVSGITSIEKTTRATLDSVATTVFGHTAEEGIPLSSVKPLPADIAKSSPRYGAFRLQFEDPRDLAAYTIGQAKKNAAHDKFVGYLKDYFPDDAAMLEHRLKVKAAIKQLASSTTEDTITVPSQGSRSAFSKLTPDQLKVMYSEILPKLFQAAKLRAGAVTPNAAEMATHTLEGLQKYHPEAAATLQTLAKKIGFEPEKVLTNINKHMTSLANGDNAPFVEAKKLADALAGIEGGENWVKSMGKLTPQEAEAVAKGEAVPGIKSAAERKASQELYTTHTAERKSVVAERAKALSASAERDNKSLSDYLDGMDDKDFKEELEEMLGTKGTFSFEGNVHNISAYAYSQLDSMFTTKQAGIKRAFETKLKDVINEGIYGHDCKETLAAFPGKTQAMLDAGIEAAARAADSHMQAIVDTGRYTKDASFESLKGIKNQNRFFNSTQATHPSAWTGWQKSLYAEQKVARVVQLLSSCADMKRPDLVQQAHSSLNTLYKIQNAFLRNTADPSMDIYASNLRIRTFLKAFAESPEEALSRASAEAKELKAQLKGGK